MTETEKDLLRAYLTNEGLRRDSEVITARQVYLHHKTETGCMRILRAHIAKATFDKLAHDLCALLNI